MKILDVLQYPMTQLRINLNNQWILRKSVFFLFSTQECTKFSKMKLLGFLADQTAPDSPKKVRRGCDDTDVSNSESFETEEEHDIDEEIKKEGLEELAAIQDKLLDNSKDKPRKDKLKLLDVRNQKILDKSLKKDVKIAKAVGKLSKYVDKYLNEDECKLNIYRFF